MKARPGPSIRWDRTPATGRLPTAVARAAAVALACTVALTGCAVAPSGAVGAEPRRSPLAAGPSETNLGAPSAPSPARVGATAASQRISFVPRELILPGRARAAVVPAATVDGVLAVPENVRRVGWWDGSAQAGDPFGTTVIAGHVDSASQGVGFSARLLRLRPGDVVSVAADGHRARYRVTAVHTVAKRALATESRAFDQLGAHRLVLITCAGTFRRDRGGYDSNVVVTARPLGRPS